MLQDLPIISAFKEESNLSDRKNNLKHFIDKLDLVNPLNVLKRGYTVTYKEDKPVIMKAIKDMKTSGIYPQKLWGE